MTQADLQGVPACILKFQVRLIRARLKIFFQVKSSENESVDSDFQTESFLILRDLVWLKYMKLDFLALLHDSVIVYCVVDMIHERESVGSWLLGLVFTNG